MAHTELGELGIDPAQLTDEDLLRELRSLHRTRLDTLRHGAEAALDNHLRRTADLETEYFARHPHREVDPNRLRDGDENDQRAAAGANGGRVGPWDARPATTGTPPIGADEAGQREARSPTASARPHRPGTPRRAR